MNNLGTAVLVYAMAAAWGTIPALAQVDLSGEWGARFHEDFHERIPGPDIGDYLGLPINDAARLRADSWDASLHTLPEWQCRPHPADYGSRGPADLRISKEVDTATQQLIAYHFHVQWQAQERTVWMDARPRPGDDAAHTWQGFSIGQWEGGQLTVTTTHLKESYLRRNGTPRSDRALLVEHWIRHANILTLVDTVTDPVYLTEPFIRTTNWEFAPEQAIEPYPCEVAEEVSRPDGQIPHHLPGANLFLSEFAKKSGLPLAAARGEAETMYPEYALKLRGSAAADLKEASHPAAIAAPPEPPGDVHLQKVRGNVYMLSGVGGNVTIQAGDEGVFLVDAGLEQMSDKILAATKQLSNKPIRYIIDTHVHPDHIEGNQKIAKQSQHVSAKISEVVAAPDQVVNDCESGFRVFFGDGRDRF